MKKFINKKFFLKIRLMNKHPKIVQIDERGQIVIPKAVRSVLGIEDGTGFFVYAIDGEGILLKKIDEPDIASSKAASALEKKASKINLNKKNLKKSLKSYKRKKKGGLDIV